MRRRHQHVAAAAAITMVVAVLCMAMVDATSKHLVKRMPADFIVWIRYWIQTATLLALFAPPMRRQLFVTRSIGLQVVRGGFLILSSTLMVLAFSAMPLAEATAVNFASPTIVTILAVLLLGEHVTYARAVSVLAGMAGVVLIVRPGSTIFQAAAIFPLISAFGGAMYQILTRKLAGDDARTMLFYGSAIGALAMTLFLPWTGAPATFDWFDLLEFLVLGWLAAGGHYLFIRALQQAPASGLAAITYLQLVFATVIGFLVFGDFPDRWTLIGMLVITASGVFLTWYERRRHVIEATEPPAID